MVQPAETESSVEVVDVPERRRYELRVDGDLAGLITYRRAPEHITLIHTEIRDEYEGRGLGSRLVVGVLNDLRAHGLAVRPECPFVARYIDEHPEYESLVAPGFVPRR